MNTVPIIILNGFLGSGKTTLLRNLLVQSHEQNRAVSVIVNDMSELDVDGVLVANTDIVGKEQHNFVTVAADSLSSPTGIKKLDQAITDLLANKTPDLIVIETSGSSHPLPLVKYLRTQTQRVALKGVLTLADSLMLDQDYQSGSLLIPRLQHNLQAGVRNTVNLLAEQIMFCSHLLLTKTDRINNDKLSQIAQSIHPLNPYVAILSMQWGNFALEELFSLPDYDFHRVEQLITELEPEIATEPESARPYNMETRVIEDDRPFHPQRLWETCQQFLGQEIYRSKGFFWLPTRDDLALLWNQAAGSISLEFISYWRAGIVEDPNNGLTENEVALLREKVAQESGRFGDRRCRLTVIGDRSQVDDFTQALKRCFLTEDEITDWQAGAQFPDPWPKTVTKRKG
ncbi:cobalamin biosynthesis protein CobW [Vibrio sp. CAIM 722]|uniref:Cobalamin biosynthesis protein CobW n=1 Tax=Vibrio eleionomae TaxID=2653505 RepID=A0A7X4LM41_9VIBR|nr:GTP-binding protein [Vibrio eleionomae]MZI94167.1 cobalamin biosynthesis protein CobW [Vibrio eleionomae]